VNAEELTAEDCDELVRGDHANCPSACVFLRAISTIAALRTQLEQAQGNFQRETLRTSELWRKLKEVFDNLCPQHGPGPWGRHGCRYCGLLLEIQALLEKPINAPAEPCDCAPGDLCTCAEDCDCRERDAHIWKHDVGWRNIEGLQETRRDTEVYE
jgi:hypothetical protein